MVCKRIVPYIAKQFSDYKTIFFKKDTTTFFNARILQLINKRPAMSCDNIICKIIFLITNTILLRGTSYSFFLLIDSSLRFFFFGCCLIITSLFLAEIRKSRILLGIIAKSYFKFGAYFLEPLNCWMGKEAYPN